MKIHLMRATRDCLRQLHGWSQGQCAISPGGYPPAMIGAFFVAVHEGNWRAMGKGYLEESLAVDVTITVPTGMIPRDRADDIYDSVAGFLDELENKVKSTIHGNQDIRKAACAYAGVASSTQGDILQTPLWCTGGGPLEPRGSDWVMGQAGQDKTYASRTINFTDATRIQSLDIQE